MANRNEKKKGHRYGLKEAYSVLQKDYLDLQKHCHGIEQHLMEVQNNFLLLKQSYAQLQEDSRMEHAKLVEKLEKSYDAYNEKYLAVEELEKNVKELTQTLESSLEKSGDQITEEPDVENSKVSRKARKRVSLFAEAVNNALNEVGLSLTKTDEIFKIKIDDLKKFEGLFEGKHCVVPLSVFKKVKDLEQSNDFLEQAMASLKEHSENQNKNLSKLNEELMQKDDECSKLQDEIKEIRKNNTSKGRQDVSTKRKLSKQAVSEKQTMATGLSNQGKVIVDSHVLETAVVRLSEMSDFTAEVKKTILYQNSWVDMIMDAMNEYKAKTSRKTKYQGATPKVSSCNSQPDVGTSSCPRAKAATDGGSGIRNYPLRLDTSVSKRLPSHRDNTGALFVTRTVRDVCDGFSSQDLPQPSNVVERLGNFPHYMETLNETKVKQNEVHGTSEENSEYLSLPSTSRVVPQQSNSARLKDETGRRADTDKTRTSQHFSIESMHSLSVDEARVKPENKLDAPATHDLCPMCDLIFDASFDVSKRRVHINEHFNN